MKLSEIKIAEEIPSVATPDHAKGKNQKLFDEFSDQMTDYVKKQIFDIRPAETGEKIKVNFRGETSTTKIARTADYVIRLHDEIEQINMIDEKTMKNSYTPISENEEADAEGFKKYRESGEYEGFQYSGENTYIFTDWNTKQRLKNGDYVLRSLSKNNSSGFVVQAADLEEHFEEVK